MPGRRRRPSCARSTTCRRRCSSRSSAYWGWYWRPVYDHAWLLVGQLVFAYAFDLLLAWSRRERYTLGFGPFPIHFSTNLFLWFRDDWFHLQFLMIAVGFLGKAFVRWERDGRRVHIFNPSAFSLGLFSVVLIATGATPITWGEDIATTLTLAPRIYLFLFLAGLVVMYRFAITLVAGSAAVVLFGLSALYSAATGVPWFVDSEIPTAVFRACTCWSPIRPPRPARPSARPASASCTAWGSSSCTRCSARSARPRSTTSCSRCRSST